MPSAAFNSLIARLACCACVRVHELSAALAVGGLRARS